MDERVVEVAGVPVAVVERFAVRGQHSNPETCVLFVPMPHGLVRRTAPPFAGQQGLFLTLSRAELPGALNVIRSLQPLLTWPPGTDAALAAALDPEGSA